MLLGDLGADVVRIERPGKGPGLATEPGTDYLLRNRRSVAANLKSDEGRDLVLQLVAKADVLIEGFRPGVTERLVLFNPIGLADTRFNNPVGDPDEAYKRNLASTYQTIRASLMRYVAHKPSAWNSQFESYVRIRYAWTLGADWPRLARVQALINPSCDSSLNRKPVVPSSIVSSSPPVACAIGNAP